MAATFPDFSVKSWYLLLSKFTEILIILMEYPTDLKTEQLGSVSLEIQKKKKIPLCGICLPFKVTAGQFSLFSFTGSIQFHWLLYASVCTIFRIVVKNDYGFVDAVERLWYEARLAVSLVWVAVKVRVDLL